MILGGFINDGGGGGLYLGVFDDISGIKRIFGMVRWNVFEK